MILLSSTADLLRVITSAAVTVDVHVSWCDLNGTTVTPGRTNVAIATATTTTVVASPAASTYRTVKTIYLRNKSGSSVDLTVVHSDGTIVSELVKVTVAAGDTLAYDEHRGWALVASQVAYQPLDADLTAIAALTTTTFGRSHLEFDLSPVASTASSLLVTAATEVYVTPAFALPANSLQVGHRFRWTVDVTSAATINTATIRLKFGTAGTIADGNVINQVLGAGSANAGSAIIIIEAVVKATGSGTTNIRGTLRVLQTGVVGFTNAEVQVFQAQVATFNSTVANFMGVGISPSAGSTVTVQTTTREVLIQ